MVEGTDPSAMVPLDRGLARLDPGCLRFHDLPADHGADIAVPSYLSERFPTEVRATAAGFCYHQGGIWGGFVAPVLAYLAANLGVGFPIPMLIATSIGLLSVIVALLVSPETRGKELLPDLVLA
jgi:MFS family permease